MSVLVSIVICTYNRRALLSRCLQSLRRAAGSRHDYEILVVDNNSTDETAAGVRELVPSFSGRLRCVSERAQGLSHARNRGIDEARGDYLAWLDDDVTVDERWLTAVHACLAAHAPDCIAARILPSWEARRPSWLSDDLLMNLGLLDYGPAPFRIRSLAHQVVGSCFVVKRSVLDGAGWRFDTRLGRKGRGLLSGEETALFLALLRAEREIWYWPDALVHHLVPAARASLRYLVPWNYACGRTQWHLSRCFPDVMRANRATLARQRRGLLVRCFRRLPQSHVELFLLVVRRLGFLACRLAPPAVALR